ncbi:(R)-mandelonitrile lyase [Antarcticimicrobium sediminis]|uniref:Cupin domain-containing protein n=1 Tax=Antarcticimicrobium sediminis TaxID=2546227 RepID=A0A4R5ES72_9RHOB|nr:cupin domain-containing protein [Antarcticimicrobium sediminis]TDE37542.1 cupin domain-containing protein [Antarcticimicrobium sediminis]
MDIHPVGSRPTTGPNPDYFTGSVSFDPVIDAPDPARVNALRVSFAPGARTAWHTHPLGQTLHVLSGAGLVALRDAAPRRIRAGDTVWIPPGEEHWHGAAPDTAMVHLAIQEKQGDSAADWLEQVSDADYLRAPE